MKTLVSILQGREDAARVLDYAVPLAKRFEAHLIGIHAEPLPIDMAPPVGFPAADFMIAGTQYNAERAAEIEKVFLERTRSEGISGEWRSAENVAGDSAALGLRTGRTADLIIAQQRDPDAAARTDNGLERLIFETGRPVLFAPYAGSVDTRFERVAIAWNGSKEAARAVFDALPFLKDAAKVEVLVVDPAHDSPNRPNSAEELVGSLARHGVSAAITEMRSGELTAADLIANRIADSGASLLVMGAFGHSRISEFLFGGVTRSVLQSMPAATLMSR